MKPPRVLLILTLLVSGHAIAQSTPPEVINYQGVLRDASDNPLDGSHNMVFRFYGAETGEDVLLTDSHTDTDPPPVGPVTVTDGLFNVHLGAGNVIGGLHPTLAETFANESGVWLEIQVGAETLSPRVRVVSAGYALNASYLDGRGAWEFLDTSSTAQLKTGQLNVEEEGNQVSLGAVGGNAIYARGSFAGGYFQDTNDTGEAWIALTNLGIKGRGSVAGGAFRDADGTGFARVAKDDLGIEAEGTEAGGHFTDSDSTGQAYIAYGNRGIEAQGSNAGGAFADSDFTSYAYIASGDRGIYATGIQWAGEFDGNVKVTETLDVDGAVDVEGTVDIWNTLRAETIHTAELTVEVEYWPDYVLADEYALMPLEELDEYLRHNSHLPGIPSAEEVRVEGLPIGALQARLLSKIEELTLYVIEQHKRIEQLEERLGNTE